MIISVFLVYTAQKSLLSHHSLHHITITVKIMLCEVKGANFCDLKRSTLPFFFLWTFFCIFFVRTFFLFCLKDGFFFSFAAYFGLIIFYLVRLVRLFFFSSISNRPVKTIIFLSPLPDKSEIVIFLK